jgi:hypothetical protein
LTQTSGNAIIESALCTSGSTNVAGLRLGLDIKVDQDAPCFEVDWIGKLGGSTVATGTIAPACLMLAMGTWATVDGSSISSGNFDTIQIVVSSFSNWQGSVYIDNIQFH